MNAKEKFIILFENLLTLHPEPTTIDNEALVFFENFKNEKPQKKNEFTDNGKLIIQYMIDNEESFTNMFKAKDIAEGVFISSRSVAGSMRKLVNDGYVDKLSGEPAIYSLTNKGKEVKLDI